jgi:replicative DNA helicase
VFSLELNHKRLVQRLLAISARAEFYRLRTGKLENEEWERVVAASEHPRDAQRDGKSHEMAL